MASLGDILANATKTRDDRMALLKEANTYIKAAEKLLELARALHKQAENL